MYRNDRYGHHESSCNNAGTQGNSSDDFFTADVVVSLREFTINRNDAITGADILSGVTSVPVATGSPAVIHLHLRAFHFKADGTQTLFTVSLSDDPTCMHAAVGPTIQSCNTLLPPVNDLPGNATAISCGSALKRNNDRCNCRCAG